MQESRFSVRDVARVQAGGAISRQPDFLALEEPLEIQISPGPEAAREWTTAAITMRTPGRDRELAVGFLFGEGILRARADIETVYSCGARQRDNSWQNRVRVALAPGAHFDPAQLQRNFYTTSSCGVCGKTSVEALTMNQFQPVPVGSFQLGEELVRHLPDRLRESQAIFDKTGGLHAAGLFTAEGEALQIAEDVGRHNAVDKVIGGEILQGSGRLVQCALVVSGRASFELVQKAVAAGVPMLVAVGAPSSLAAETAEKFGLTLVGFTKSMSFNIYSGVQRVRTQTPSRVAKPVAAP